MMSTTKIDSLFDEDDQDPSDSLYNKKNYDHCVVSMDHNAIRLDQFLVMKYPEKSRSFLQKLISNGLVTVNGKDQKAGFKVKAGDQILMKFPEPIELQILPENIPLDILYEDEDLLVVNKPKGMVVHPAPGHYTGTLVNALLYHCADSLSGINGVMRPGIVHRIDRDTTGSLIVCKNDAAHNSVAAQISAHSVNRQYRAIVIGSIRDEEGIIDAPIGRHPIDRKKMAVSPGGRRAVTHYKVLERFKGFTYVECRLETGRTHQIRVHMSSIGHPVLGDEIYGPSRCEFHLEGQTLHAMTIGFIHPRTGNYMEFTAPLPEYFQKLLDILRKRS